MGLVGDLVGGGLKGILDGASTIIGQFHASPEEKAAAQQALLKLQIDAALAEKQIAAEIEKAQMADLANLREQMKVELQSTDAYVRRARPTFLWMMYVIFFVNFGLPAIVGYFGVTAPKIEIPTDLYYIFGGSFLGYSYLRTKEKVGNGKSA